MKKRKNIAIPMILATTIAAVSVPCSSQIVMASDTYQVGVSKGYLALRSAMAYDSSNEIGELYSGDTVEVTEYTTSDYWYVYSPKLNLSGYVNNDYLYFLSSQPTSSSGSYTVSVAKGYLALRSTKAYDSSNEIGQLYSGDTVTVSDSSDPQYWYVYSPKLNLSGYVNKDYLYYSGDTAASAQSSSGNSRTVSVAKGYLALRSAKAYDSSNEIGQLYSGDTVQLIDTSDSQYWYVYSQKLGKNGYVNKDYLIGGTTTYATRTVSVATGYLALRSAKAYDSSNEIGQLYSGDTVQLVDTTDAQYWYIYSQKLCKYGYVNKDYYINLFRNTINSYASLHSLYTTKQKGLTVMSPKRQVNHNIRKHFNTIIYNISRYAEIALSMVILLVIALAGFRLIMEVADTSVMSMDTEFFSTFLSQALSLVVGVEFVKMLCQHSAQTVVEVLMFATARQMVVEHLGPAETLLGVLSIAVLFAIRKYLMTDNDDMNAHNCSKNTEEN